MSACPTKIRNYGLIAGWERLPSILEEVGICGGVQIERFVVRPEGPRIWIKLGHAATNMQDRFVDAAPQERPGSLGESPEIGSVIFHAPFELCAGEKPDIRDWTVTHIA